MRARASQPSRPESWRQPIARGLRASVLAPFLYLQQQSEELRTSRARYDQVVAQRDSSALAAGFVPELRNENARLRSLLGLGQRLGGGFVAAEVLHQPEPTNPLTLVLSAGRHQGVQPLAAVVSPDGLLGLVSAVDPNSSVAVTWAYPEFRASAMSADGSVFGIVAPHGTEGPGVWLLELRGIGDLNAVVANHDIVDDQRFEDAAFNCLFPVFAGFKFHGA